MQKGSLERDDYIRLGLLVLCYFMLRPYIQKVFKYFFSGDIQEGEEIREKYEKSMSKAKLDPNTLRDSKKHPGIEEGPAENGEAVGTGRKARNGGAAVNRKVKFAPEKTEEEKLLDWDDEPARRPTEGDTADVATWLDKWDQ